MLSFADLIFWPHFSPNKTQSKSNVLWKNLNPHAKILFIKPLEECFEVIHVFQILLECSRLTGLLCPNSSVVLPTLGGSTITS